jgi:hypothetical protein
MAEEHKESWKTNRTDLQEYVRGLCLLLPGELQHPTEVCEKVEGISVKDGWICGWHGCLVAGANRDWVVKHCRKTHGKEAVEEKTIRQGRIQSLLGHPYIK